MKTKYEFILIGVGVNDITDRGADCNPPPEWPDTCPKGVPSFRADEGHEADKYAEDGYICIQGPGRPEALGGARFATEAAGMKWLASKDGIKFKDVFKNVFLARVVALSQPKP
ncbi:MAG: hypothetical protein ABI583_02370 [Betaproteobacteria bacterium]